MTIVCIECDSAIRGQTAQSQIILSFRTFSTKTTNFFVGRSVQFACPFGRLPRCCGQNGIMDHRGVVTIPSACDTENSYCNFGLLLSLSPSLKFRTTFLKVLCVSSFLSFRFIFILRCCLFGAGYERAATRWRCANICASVNDMERENIAIKTHSHRRRVHLQYPGCYCWRVLCRCFVFAFRPLIS